jgi:hypothetical protein
MNIINYTHYHTDDIRSIAEHVEKFPGFSGWAVDQLVFTEFDPKNPYESSGRRYRYSNSGAPVKKYTSKMRWADRARLSLLVPSKIYENPLEALAQGEDQFAPKAMVAAIVVALRERANGINYNAKVGAELPGLRVLGKVEQKRPMSNSDTLTQRNTYARRNLGVPSYDARRAIRELAACQKKNLKAARTHLKERAGLVDPVEAAIIDAINALGRVIVATENARQGL